MIVGFSSAEAHAELVAPIRAKLPPLFELVTPIPFAALQQMFDESSPWGCSRTRRLSISTSFPTMQSR